MNNTAIEWTDLTWNPVTGCSPVSEGCRNCYARRMATRLRGRCGYPAEDPFRVTYHPERLNEPFKIKTPKRIFVCSMGDLFHKEVNWQWYGEIFRVIRETPHHTYIILTKRPFIAARQFNLELMLSGMYLCDIPLSNVQLGVSCSNQSDVDKFVPEILQIPAAKRIISLEPLLGLVHTQPWLPELDGVIVGGETGPGARPMHPDWVRKIRDDCQAAGVKFFFKGWGDFLPYEIGGIRFPGKPVTSRLAGDGGSSETGMWWKCGKKLSGCILDGREWSELP